ncbi:hypothetical protein B0H13DRAFT_2393343 [Mycena leptocephala]|nr:hypothetical protein B0H13DRAFT_2393343 [Mycena leptocephala]
MSSLLYRFWRLFLTPRRTGGLRVLYRLLLCAGLLGWSRTVFYPFVGLVFLWTGRGGGCADGDADVPHSSIDRRVGVVSLPVSSPLPSPPLPALLLPSSPPLPSFLQLLTLTSFVSRSQRNEHHLLHGAERVRPGARGGAVGRAFSPLFYGFFFCFGFDLFFLERRGKGGRDGEAGQEMQRGRARRSSTAWLWACTAAGCTAPVQCVPAVAGAGWHRLPAMLREDPRSAVLYAARAGHEGEEMHCAGASQLCLCRRRDVLFRARTDALAVIWVYGRDRLAPELHREGQDRMGLVPASGVSCAHVLGDEGVIGRLG